MNTSSMASASTRFCSTHLTRTPSAQLRNFLIPNPPHLTTHAPPKTFFSSANRRTIMSDANIREIVKEKYGQAALRVTHKTGGSSCCGATAASGLSCDPIASNLYDESQSRQIPEEAMLASLGCGNPPALAPLRPGEAVLDLGSGGGIDVLLSGRRVGPTGKGYGLDMTDEMLALANENKRNAG